MTLRIVLLLLILNSCTEEDHSVQVKNADSTVLSHPKDTVNPTLYLEVDSLIDFNFNKKGLFPSEAFNKIVEAFVEEGKFEMVQQVNAVNLEDRSKRYHINRSDSAMRYEFRNVLNTQVRFESKLPDKSLGNRTPVFILEEWRFRNTIDRDSTIKILALYNSGYNEGYDYRKNPILPITYKNSIFLLQGFHPHEEPHLIKYSEFIEKQLRNDNTN